MTTITDKTDAVLAIEAAEKANAGMMFDAAQLAKKFGESADLADLQAALSRQSSNLVALRQWMICPPLAAMSEQGMVRGSVTTVDSFAGKVVRSLIGDCAGGADDNRVPNGLHEWEVRFAIPAAQRARLAQLLDRSGVTAVVWQD